MYETHGKKAITINKKDITALTDRFYVWFMSRGFFLDSMDELILRECCNNIIKLWKISIQKNAVNENGDPYFFDSLLNFCLESVSAGKKIIFQICTYFERIDLEFFESFILDNLSSKIMFDNFILKLNKNSLQIFIEFIQKFMYSYFVIGETAQTYFILQPFLEYASYNENFSDEEKKMMANAFSVFRFIIQKYKLLPSFCLLELDERKVLEICKKVL